MDRLIKWINENKIRVAFIGGAIVIGSQWGTCTLEPTVETPEEQQQEEE